MKRPCYARVSLALFSTVYCADKLDLGGLFKTLEDSMARLSQGDFSEIEAKLFAQAQTLQVMFTYLSKRMLKQEYIKNMESFCRLALKAQDQSRRTLETLAQMKKPSVVIAQQANIAQGPQQVNNHCPAIASEQEKIKSNERLRERRKADGESVGPGRSATASRVDSKMATVGIRDGAKNR